MDNPTARVWLFFAVCQGIVAAGKPPVLRACFTHYCCDRKKLSQRCRRSKSQWKKCQEILLQFFHQITTIRRIRPHAVYLWQTWFFIFVPGRTMAEYGHVFISKIMAVTAVLVSAIGRYGNFNAILLVFTPSSHVCSLSVRPFVHLLFGWAFTMQ